MNLQAQQNLVEFMYQETQIHFLVTPNDKNVMVNATEMAKVFNKRVEDFKRLEGTEKFIEALLRSENSKFEHADVREQLTEKDVIYGTNKATFMHRKLALKFATWLDVDFDLWIIDTIDEILFSKIESIERAITFKQEKIKERDLLIEKAIRENNTDLLELLQLEKDIKITSSLENKAINELKNQYKMNI